MAALFGILLAVHGIPHHHAEHAHDAALDGAITEHCAACDFAALPFLPSSDTVLPGLSRTLALEWKAPLSGVFAGCAEVPDARGPPTA